MAKGRRWVAHCMCVRVRCAGDAQAQVWPGARVARPGDRVWRWPGGWLCPVLAARRAVRPCLPCSRNSAHRRGRRRLCIETVAFALGLSEPLHGPLQTIGRRGGCPAEPLRRSFCVVGGGLCCRLPVGARKPASCPHSRFVRCRRSWDVSLIGSGPAGSCHHIPLNLPLHPQGP